MSACRSCGADWGRGEWKWSCAECGGGALEKPCECFQSCGASYRRAVMDSNDYRRSHWLGGCGAPIQELVERWKRLIAITTGSPHVKLVLEELATVPTATDAYWAGAPSGPPRLQVLRDEVAGQGLAMPARVLASALFSVE
jgi:hypothetical protein